MPCRVLEEEGPGRHHLEGPQRRHLDKVTQGREGEPEGHRIIVRDGVGGTRVRGVRAVHKNIHFSICNYEEGATNFTF